VLGAEAVTSVLGTAVYQQIPEGYDDLGEIEMADDNWSSPDVNRISKSKRRLLIFSDSRQDAAFFATYLESSYNQILQRRLIINTLEKYQEKVIANRWRLLDTLIIKIEGIIENLNEDGSVAFQKNNHEQAQKIAGNAQKVTLFLGKVQELQNKWTEIYGKGSL
jgi:hypothetical protein